MRGRRFWPLTAALYALALAAGALWLAAVLAPLPAQRELSVQDARWTAIRDDYPVDWMDYHTGSLLTTDGDSCFEWELQAPVRTLYMRVRSTQPIRDPQLYYTTSAQQGYTDARCVAPAWCDAAAGEYLFYLPRTVKVDRLRLDVTASAGAFFALDELRLNAPLRPLQALLLDGALPARAAALAVLPGLAALTVSLFWPMAPRRRQKGGTAPPQKGR